MARTHVDLELRWGDQDAYGHVNNVAYARYLEEARVRTFWLGSGRERTGMERHFRGDDPDGPKMLVASQQIEFLRVLEYAEQPITVELWIGKLGGSSLEVHYEIVDGSQPERTVVARAITVVVIVDGKTLRPMRLSGEGRESVEAWMDEPLQLGRR
ncbi:thioesterase [Leucobacter sp. OLJS4]|uniref:acyl-CoA thioesterase n=1 Tax=unclassified Leucobacter TaxID=2621730 RepID=UPI000C183FEA|nr:MULTISPECIES: thioesterase family protein [unclassified Leucobacter]PIJ33840.1 thioesterase [Leucobacter sp. OLES1]PII81314.1 thioesterase [Leucobacter sp. OLCALW19]PII85981.1 thioesterase [Leucobacter sp. OLTLW20]PII89877.1 thioesterase [Leucobacter sp. OLAS13]PII96908.1 thioesterase [Leucobacter sp. OLDS2]